MPESRVIRYVVCPGIGASKPGGRERYLGPWRLMMLYRVSEDECVIVDPYDDDDEITRSYKGHDPATLIHLFPRSDGIYEVPK